MYFSPRGRTTLFFGYSHMTSVMLPGTKSAIVSFRRGAGETEETCIAEPQDTLEGIRFI